MGSHYEDFTTIGLVLRIMFMSSFIETVSLTSDWIQESIAERNRRMHDEKARAACRGPRGEITPAWVWAQLRRLLSEAESWIVITLVG